jgi:hypothetical protein
MIESANQEIEKYYSEENITKSTNIEVILQFR